MVTRVDVPGELIAWARERSGVDFDSIANRFPRLTEWEHGDVSPTLKQLESFASYTHTPVGFFFLPEPPDEHLPLPDFRTMGENVRTPTADLLDTIYQCQQRQDWYRDYAISRGEDTVSFVESLRVGSDVFHVAELLRETLGLEVRERASTWSKTLTDAVERAEDLGILVMINGVVGSNTHRRLKPEEFRGFALVDSYAPVVFINGADTKSAQIFTLVHEISHIGLGQPGLDDAEVSSISGNTIERWCNLVAAEVLVPISVLRQEYDSDNNLPDEISRLAVKLKASTLVVLRRLFEAGYLDHGVYVNAYQAELRRLQEILDSQQGDSNQGESGGNFYNTQPVRMSKKFTRAVVTSTLEGRTLHRDAYHMLGFKKTSTFHRLADRLGVG